MSTGCWSPIRGGGHNVGGRALCDGGLVIDLSRMKGIHVDPQARRVRVQPGVTLGELDRETHVFGLAVPLGVVSKTGVAGLTLGGGVGWLARKYGLTCDNVESFELVTADGEVLRASADEHPDLFWALRGGGGNFGVVTSFEYRLHPVSTVLGGLIVYPRERATELLKFYRSFTPSSPDELAAYAALLHTPDGHPAAAIRGVLLRRSRRRRTSPRAAARVRHAAPGRHPADAVSRDADADRRRGSRRQPELLEVGVPA